MFHGRHERGVNRSPLAVASPARLGLLLLSLALTVGSGASLSGSPAAGPKLWQPVQPDAVGAEFTRPGPKPEKALFVKLNHAALKSHLARAATETARAPHHEPATLSLPLPDGTEAEFQFVESPVLAPELAARFPEIKTYAGWSAASPAASVRFDSTPAGFHAQILSPHGAVYIEPFGPAETNLHVCYYKRDCRPPAAAFQCLTPASRPAPLHASRPATLSAAAPAGSLRSYRLACAATGEYTRFHGGTVAAGLAAIASAVNRVTGIFETELGIRLVLVADNDRLVYTNPNTDPYTSGNLALMLSQNQANLDATLGSANYDLGHVFSTEGGGLAAIGVLGLDGCKAFGHTGVPAPAGDAFYIDYVAHELGHQFGAQHTFNGTNSACAVSRCEDSAYEPGSGSTLMAYAGLCGADNLQPHSDPYFHAISREQILQCVASSPAPAGPVFNTPANTAPEVSAGPNFLIPANTPFELTASASDPDGDPLTFCWEQLDLGPPLPPDAPGNAAGPLFRSFSPSTSPRRAFPRLADILANTATPGETLPATSRTLNFRVTARDNHPGGGNAATSDMQVVVVAGAGPFRLTSPGRGVAWSGAQTVTWDVAGTTNAPILATHVTLLLSTDGGLSFPFVLAAGVPNTGSCGVRLPDVTTSEARVRLQADGHIFFDISRANFSISPAGPAPPPVIQSLQVANGAAVITWTSTPGRAYRLESRDRMPDGIWLEASPPVIAVGPATSATNTLGAAAQRFYRVVELR